MTTPINFPEPRDRSLIERMFPELFLPTQKDYVLAPPPPIPEPLNTRVFICRTCERATSKIDRDRLRECGWTGCHSVDFIEYLTGSPEWPQVPIMTCHRGDPHYVLRNESHTRAIIRSFCGEPDGSEPSSILKQDYYAHPRGYECRDVAEAFNFNLGNALKYIWRVGLAAPKGKLVEDLKKARNYIDFEIERLEREQ